MIFAYIILILIICYLVSRKKHKNISSKSENPPKSCIAALCKFIIGIFVVYTGFIIFTADLFIQDYWLFFGEKRTIEIENMYGISVGNGIKLKRYKAIAHMEGTMRTLEFESDINGLNFIDKNFSGKLLKYAENDMLYELTSSKTEPYKFNPEDKISGVYWYKYQDKEYQMTFYSEGDSYRVKIY